PGPGADLKQLTAAQGVPVAITTTALVRRPSADAPVRALNVHLPDGTDVQAYHTGRELILARYSKLVKNNPGDEFVCRARRMAMAQVILHVNNRLPMAARPDLGNLAGLLHELIKHWKPPSGKEDAEARKARRKLIRDAFFAKNPGGLTRFLPLV